MKLANESQEVKAARLTKRREKCHAQKLQNPKIYQTPKVTDGVLNSSELIYETQDSFTKHLEIDKQQKYLQHFDSALYGPLHDQSWAKANIHKFYTSLQYSVNQCAICKEALPLQRSASASSSYPCARCVGDKQAPKKFSVENSMVPGQVPEQLQNLTQVEEMLIARALLIMRAYIKPGGHRGYSGHCINLPQNITEIASALSRYPKDISVIVVKVIGKNNTFKDVNVRRHKVDSAFVWLIQNNPHYNDVKVDNSALCSLLENGVPFDISTVDADSDILSDEIPHPDQGPLNEEDVVYNKSTEMSSFLPVGRHQKQEVEAICMGNDYS